MICGMTEIFVALLQGRTAAFELGNVVLKLLNVLLRLFGSLALGLFGLFYRLFYVFDKMTKCHVDDPEKSYDRR